MSSFHLLEVFNSCIIAIKMSSTHDTQEEKAGLIYKKFCVKKK